MPDWDPADRSLAGQPEAGVGRFEGQAGSQVRRYARNRTKPRKQDRTATCILPADFARAKYCAADNSLDAQINHYSAANHRFDDPKIVRPALVRTTYIGGNCRSIESDVYASDHLTGLTTRVSGAPRRKPRSQLT